MKKLQSLLSFWDYSTLGKKYAMALSGAAMLGFVFVHMAGNLLIFFCSPEHGHLINDYAAKLKSVPEVVWLARMGLLLAVTVHFTTGIQLCMENREARPIPYQPTENAGFGTKRASRWMVVSGSIVAVFIVVHLLHFTIPWLRPDYGHLHDSFERHDVFAMVTAAFSNSLVCLFYFIGVGTLCYHLSHGISAMFQTLGLKTKKHAALIEAVAPILSVALFVGFSVVPLSVWLGILKVVEHQ
jgi:succinate dehydrogenase / fumarate reductase cytochrome b subunit